MIPPFLHTFIHSNTHLVEVIHEHLPHLVHRHGGIDGAFELQLAHEVGEEAEVEGIREAEEDCIDLMNVPGKEGQGRREEGRERKKERAEGEEDKERRGIRGRACDMHDENSNITCTCTCTW